MTDFQINLKALRKQNSLTQKKLAKILNVSEDSIYNWEKGRSEPSIDDLIALATTLDTTIDFLVGKDKI